MIKNLQLLTEVRHPEPLENLVESMPVKNGLKLSDSSLNYLTTKVSWVDLRGLGWLFCEDWS